MFNQGVCGVIYISVYEWSLCDSMVWLLEETCDTEYEGLGSIFGHVILTPVFTTSLSSLSGSKSGLSCNLYCRRYVYTDKTHVYVFSHHM